MSNQSKRRDPGIVLDLAFILGLGLAGAGLWLIDYRLACVFFGLVLMTVAVVVARR